MKEFNKEKELHKLKFKNNKNKYIKYASIILSCVILLVGIIYFTFAKFESNKSYTLIQGKLGDYSSGDINIAFNVDGNSSNTMPSKGTGYKYKRAECNDNNVEVIFNKNEWYATVTKVTQKTKCTLYFETVTEVEVTLYGGVNEIITVDNDDTYTMDSTGKLENVTLSVDEHELKGSISNQTFTVNVDSEANEVYAMPNNGDGVIYWYGTWFNNSPYYPVPVIGSSSFRATAYNPTFNTNNIYTYCNNDAYGSTRSFMLNNLVSGDYSNVNFLTDSGLYQNVFDSSKYPGLAGHNYNGGCYVALVNYPERKQNNMVDIVKIGKSTYVYAIYLE